jgi:hypothetical protein
MGAKQPLQAAASREQIWAFLSRAEDIKEHLFLMNMKGLSKKN